jgi:hypothetical protein
MRVSDEGVRVRTGNGEEGEFVSMEKIADQMRGEYKFFVEKAIKGDIVKFIKSEICTIKSAGNI